MLAVFLAQPDLFAQISARKSA